MERRSNITSSPGLIPAMLVIDQSSDAAFVDVKDSRRRVSSLWLGEEIFRLCRDREKLVYNGQTTSAGSATDGDDLELFKFISTMDSIIELQRQTHEETERFERALATVLSKPQPNQQVKLTNEHKASQILDRITSRVSSLNTHYQDEATRKAELDLLSGSKPDDLSEFYTRLQSIKDYHQKYPNQVVGEFQLELAALVEDKNFEGGDDDEEEEEDREHSIEFCVRNY